MQKNSDVFYRKNSWLDNFIQGWVTVLLAESSMLMSPQYNICRKKKRSTSPRARLLHANIWVCDEAMEKMEKQLNVWIHEMMTNNKSIVDSTVVRLKAKGIYRHMTQRQVHVKPFLASTDWLTRFKRLCSMKNFKLSVEDGSLGQITAEEF